MAKIDALVEDIESWEASPAQTTVIELLQALLQLHGAGLARLLRLVAHRDLSLVDRLAQDALVSHLLLLHNLHPTPVETRVARALEEVRPLLQSHGVRVELLGVEGGVARLRLHGAGHEGPDAAARVKLAIAESIQKQAPDLEGLEVEGISEPLGSGV